MERSGWRAAGPTWTVDHVETRHIARIAPDRVARGAEVAGPRPPDSIEPDRVPSETDDEGYGKSAGGRNSGIKQHFRRLHVDSLNSVTHFAV